MRAGIAAAAALALAGCAMPAAAPDRTPGLAEQRIIAAERVLCEHDGRPPGIDCDGVAVPSEPRRSVIEWQPDARSLAAALDAEPIARGPLHGWPVLLKANIDTADGLATTAGSLAMAGFQAPSDAPLVAHLREAGLVIAGKTNLSEWANFRSTESVSGWSSIGGQTRHALDPSRNPCGSSSGSAVAVALGIVALAVGTETDGSIICPSSINGVVGIKPTLGLVSQQGIIPIAHSQDTAGPMARTVTQAGWLLAAMTGPGSEGDGVPDGVLPLSPAWDADALVGARIGVLRSYWGSGALPGVEAAYTAALDRLVAAGAELVDPIEIEAPGIGDAEYTVLLYEFKADLNAYLAAREAPMASLASIIAFNAAHPALTMPHFGQDILQAAEATGGLQDPVYLEALSDSKSTAISGLLRALRQHELDAIVAPSNAPAWRTDYVAGDVFLLSSSRLAAVSGFPSITVPAGEVDGLPFGLSFIGEAWSDARLIELAYAFEQREP